MRQAERFQFGNQRRGPFGVFLEDMDHGHGITSIQDGVQLYQYRSDSGTNHRF